MVHWSLTCSPAAAPSASKRCHAGPNGACSSNETVPPCERSTRISTALGLNDRSKVLASDAVSVAASVDADIVFADPPYDFDDWGELLGRVSADLVVAESGRQVEAPAGWHVIREKKYGRTRVTFLERNLERVVDAAVGSPTQ